jgi:protein SCO1
MKLLPMKHLPMQRAIFLALAVCFSVTPMCAQKRYPVTGIILKVDSPHLTFVSSCAAIPGYMEAMVMPFTVRDAKALDGLQPGAHIEFTLVVGKDHSYAEAIRIHHYESLEQEPLRARRLQLLTDTPPGGMGALAPGQPVADFTLTDQTGQPVSLSQFVGKVVAVTFIYTSCPLPDYCFRLSNNFARLAKRFAGSMGRDLVLLSITFDPVHDQPNVLAKYANTWKADPKSWHFLTGPLPAVKAVCLRFGLNFWQDEGSLTHSLHTVVIDRQGKLAANFEGNELTAEQLGDFVQVVLEPAADDPAAIQDALAALERGDFTAAEQKLRAVVQSHPNQAPALTLLGVALDNLRKFPEADAVHRRAVANAPRSPDVLNNYANHLLGAADEAGARKVYLQVVALDPANFNANVQLAQIALKGKHGAEALDYLQRLPASQQDAANLAILRLGALYLAGDRAPADALAARLYAAAAGDLALSFSAGMALANAGEFDRAETFFSKALAASPADFNVLFNLGLVASRAGHNQRAREVLEAALRQQPRNLDVLYNLASVDSALNQTDAALRLLAQAARLAPQRADIQRLLAITTSDLGALEDAAAAWDLYLKLEPDDDSARRERGFTATRMGKVQQGLADLDWFVERHPGDAVGHYELGLALSKDEPVKGLAHLDRAIALKPDFAVAHSARGSLYYQAGKFAAALSDLETAASLRPDDAVALDRLGQTYSALDRSADAVRVLRRAAALAPDDSKTMLHFARALADAGQTSESKAAMDRFRQLGPVTIKSVPAGLVDYLSLTPEQQHADYRARVEKAARENPSDAVAQVNLLKLLLEDGALGQVAATAHRIAGLHPPAAILAGAGRALLQSGQYPPARELLEQAAAAGPSADVDVDLDLAIATLRATGAREALQLMDRVPQPERSGDYYLARAQMLDASGKLEDAASAVDQALQAAPKRPDLYRQAAVFLVKNGQLTQALGLLDLAVRLLPDDREILLMRATTLERAGRTADATRLLDEMRNRWPEWHAIWVAQGVILQIHQHFEDARQSLDTAVALGARSPEVYYYLADSILRSAGGRLDAAEAAIRNALRQAPEDPWILALAGQVAFANGDYQTAVQRLRDAVRLAPAMVQPHIALARAYGALARPEEAQAELDRVKAIQRDSSGADQEPPYTSTLFQRKPARDW